MNINLDNDQGKQSALVNIFQFIEEMNLEKNLCIELSKDAEQIWKTEDQIDEQNKMGQDIIKTHGRQDLGSIVVIDSQRRPILLINHGSRGWDGLSIDPRLRANAAKKLTEVMERRIAEDHWS